MPTVAQLLQDAQRKRTAGDPRAAEDFLRRALAIDPANAFALSALGSLLAQTGRPAEGEAFLERAARAQPRVAATMVMLAGAQQSQGKVAQAVETLRQACAAEPANAEAHGALAAACELAGRADDARAAAHTALRLRPANLLAERTLAKLALRDEQWADARQRIESLLARRELPDAIRGAAWLDLGQSLDRLGRHADAFDAFTRGKAVLAQTPESRRFDPRVQIDWLDGCLRWARALKQPPAWPGPPDDAPFPTPVFFVGFLRSGTTLLEQMLDAHGAFVTSNEAPLLPAALATAARSVGRSVRFPALLEAMGEPDVRAARAAYWSAAQKAVDRDALTSRRLIDKMALNISSLPLVRRLWPDARVIVALRDPRDVCLSCFMQHFRPDFTSVHFHTIEDAARLYAAMMGLWLEYRRTLGLAWIEAKYEDLVADPAAALRRVLDFLGADWRDAALDHAASVRRRAIVTPGAAAVGKAVYTHAAQRWRRYEPQLERVQPTLQPLVEALGYT